MVIGIMCDKTYCQKSAIQARRLQPRDEHPRHLVGGDGQSKHGTNIQ